MENKKISFSFGKVALKKVGLIRKPVPEEKELIDCVEQQSIKLKNGAPEEVKQPLVIPVEKSGVSLIDKIKKAREKSGTADSVPQDLGVKKADTLEELAVQELILEAQKKKGGAAGSTMVLKQPANEDKFMAEGAAEPTLGDYEDVAVSEYGMAMLRGMGWSEGTTVGKNPSKPQKLAVPDLRPKGLGLGATKLVNEEKSKPSVDKDGKELLLIKGGVARIIAGNNKGYYCQIQGLDDDKCEVIVKTSPGNKILSLSEVFLVPVTQEEFNSNSKVINIAKYEQYKASTGNGSVKQETEEPSEIRKERSRSKDRSQRRSSGKDDNHSTNKPTSNDTKVKTEKNEKSRKSKSRERGTKRNSSSSSVDDKHSASKRTSRHNSKDVKKSESSRSDEKKTSSKSRQRSKSPDHRERSRRRSSCSSGGRSKDRSSKHTSRKSDSKSSRKSEKSDKSRKDRSKSKKEKHHSRDREHKKHKKCKSRHRHSSGSGSESHSRRRK